MENKNYKITIVQINTYKTLRIELIDFTKKYIERKNYLIFDSIKSALEKDEEYINTKIEIFEEAIKDNYYEIIKNNYFVAIDDWDINVLNVLQDKHKDIKMYKSRTTCDYK